MAGAAGWARDEEAILAVARSLGARDSHVSIDCPLIDKGYTGDHKGPPIRSTPLSPLRTVRSFSLG